MKHSHFVNIRRNRVSKLTLKGVLLLVAFFCISQVIRTQVTIGIGEPPEKAALLQLMDTITSDGSITANTGGLLLPRVKLVDRKTLEPFILIQDPEWIDISSSGIDVKHTGLMVYNIYESPESESNPDKIFKPGGYLWNGNLWIAIPDSLLFEIEGVNGITSSDSADKIRIELGGELKEDKAIDLNEHNLIFSTKSGTLKIQGDTSGASVIDAQPSLEIVGKMKINPVPVYEGEQQRLVVNRYGEVGVETTANVVSLMTYAQSEDAQQYAANSQKTTSFNAGTPIVVSWQTSDFIINNITFFDEDNNEFEILDEGYYEVSGYVNYQPKYSGDFAGLNTIIQYKLSSGTTWQELSLARKIFTEQPTATVIIPNATIRLKSGDKIRMILAKPSGIGQDHGTINSSLWGIKRPTGGNFSKGLKIEAI